MDCVGLLVRVDGDVAGLVDAEVALAPVADAVGLDGVLDLPLVHQFRLSAFRHRRGLHKEQGTAFGRLAFALSLHYSPVRDNQRTEFPWTADFFAPPRRGCRSIVKNRSNAARRTTSSSCTSAPCPRQAQSHSWKHEISWKRQRIRQSHSTIGRLTRNRLTRFPFRCYLNTSPRSEP